MMSNDKLRMLIERGRANLVAQVRAVSRLLNSPIGGADIVSIAEAQSITHQIKGSSGSIGFMELASAATALDEELQTILKLAANMGIHQQASLALLETLQSIASETICEKSALFDLDLSTLRSLE